jgi:hypothetical protein
MRKMNTDLPAPVLWTESLGLCLAAETGPAGRGTENTELHGEEFSRKNTLSPQKHKRHKKEKGRIGMPKEP